MDLPWPRHIPRVGVKPYLCLQCGGEPGREQAAVPENNSQTKAPGKECPLTYPGSAAAPLQTCPAGTALFFCQLAPAIRPPAHPCTCLLGHRLSRSPNPCHFRVWNKKVPVVTSLHRFGVTSKPKATSREAQATRKGWKHEDPWPGKVEELRASPCGVQRHHPTMGNETQLLPSSGTATPPPSSL